HHLRPDRRADCAAFPAWRRWARDWSELRDLRHLLRRIDWWRSAGGQGLPAAVARDVGREHPSFDGGSRARGANGERIRNDTRRRLGGVARDGTDEVPGLDAPS